MFISTGSKCSGVFGPVYHMCWQLPDALLKCSTVVWEKFTIGYFRVKVVCGEIFSSLEVSDENFLTTKYFKVKLFVPLLTNLMHNYT